MLLRILFVAAVIGVALALPSVAGAQLPTQDSVALTEGPAQANDFTVLTLRATSGPSGEDATGEVRVEVFGGVITQAGPVTCLDVDGNTAIIRFVDEVFLLGTAVTVSVVDDEPDTFELLFPSGGDPTDCSPQGTPSGFGGPLSSGDITVIDASPLPISKDQCKNGGWQTFGVFENQGDCVSFVATKGKNPPANSP